MQLSVLQNRVVALEDENNDLRSELGAFDDAFWQDLEDMKLEKSELQHTCAEQARLIGQLQAQLGQSAARSAY